MEVIESKFHDVWQKETLIWAFQFITSRFSAFWQQMPDILLSQPGPSFSERIFLLKNVLLFSICSINL